MQDPRSLLEQTKAQLEAAGIPPDAIKVTGVEPGDDGGVMLKVSVRPDIAEEAIRMFTLRLYTGTDIDEQLPRLLDVRREGEPANPSPKQWTATERQKVEKPKIDTVPDHS